MRSFKFFTVAMFIANLTLGATAQTTELKVHLDGNAVGPRFDGIGAVSGGGATSVLLKDYPKVQRDQVLDLLFKPKFGASISSLYVEVPGDGNSTQGTESSHMHTRGDENYFRGYEWWLMKEAKARNPQLALDACAWSCPAWVGDGKFFSQDMCDYYSKWIKGLYDVHGLKLDAIGCRNEKGVDIPFVKKLRQTLNSNGQSGVKIHAFDNWGKNKWDWCKELETDPELAASVDVIGNHTMTEVGTPDFVKDIAAKLNKPIWNSEEHIYKDGFDCAISIVQAFNQNYIRDKVTKITNWYLVGSVYDNEPYPVQPNMLVANSPWSGSFRVREALWGYAHYGQFCEIGWKYLNGGCANLPEGGSYVTLVSPNKNYSIVAETQGAKAPQTVVIDLAGGLSVAPLCVWRSDSKSMFQHLADVSPQDGKLTLTLEPDSIYSFSTTRGQHKGSYDSPPAHDFPMPYRESFDHYGDLKQFGYLPHYTADIVGVFELAQKPDGPGTCLKQILDSPAQSWAPEWMPYTVLGGQHWKDYEVSADVLLPGKGWAGLLGHVMSTGNGWNNAPKGYYFRVSDEGDVELYASMQADNNPAGDRLTTSKIASYAKGWHKLTLRFTGAQITGLVDGVQVATATSSVFPEGMVGLMAGDTGGVRNVAYFDNLEIKESGQSVATDNGFNPASAPLYN